MTRRSSVVCVIAIVITLIASAAGCDRRGPNPTIATISAVTGPFAIETTTVPAGNGFGGGTIYSPTDTSLGLWGGVAIVPGYTAYQSSISWYGPRLASQGFVVFTIDTITTLDPPNSRGDQLLAALDYLTTTSSVASRVDPKRLAVMGWSMGGGGSLFAAKNRPALKAAIPLAGFAGVKDFSTVTVPTMLVGCQNDTIAPNADYSLLFYNSLPATTRKAYLEIKAGDHYCVTTPNTIIARSVISWLKRFVDADTRYDQFLCPNPADATISNYLSDCPA